MIRKRIVAPVLIAIFAFGFSSCSLEGYAQAFESREVSTSISTISATSTARIIAPPTSTITPVPMPTLSQEEREEMLSTLLENNGDCEFPCWWGIAPGTSDYRESREFIQALASSVRRTTREGETFLNATIPVPFQASSKGELHLTMLRNKQGFVDSLSVYGYSISKFPLSAILASLGVPSEIRYFSPLWFVSDQVDYYLYLFYPDKGIMIEYYSTSISPNPEESIQVCDLEWQEFEDNSVGLVFWDASKRLTFDQAISLPIDRTYTPPLVEIQFISDFEPLAFYDNFLSDNPVCVKIDMQKYAEFTD